MRAENSWFLALQDKPGERREQAATEILDYLRAALYRSFADNFSSDELAEIAQESMLNVQQKLYSFDHKSSFKTWVTAIAVNKALGIFRKRKRVQISLEAAVLAGEEALEIRTQPAQRSMRDKQLRLAIETVLSPKQKQALHAELGGLSMLEVARLSNSSKATTYKLLHDARKKLRRYFDENGIKLSDLSEEGGHASIA